MNKIFIKKTINILCPKHRVSNYLAYVGHVFDIKHVKFFKKIKFLESSIDVLFVDLENLTEDDLNLLFNKKINLILILLWNADIDYYIYKKKINLIKKKFKVQLISLSNFSKNIYFPLNNFIIKKRSSLKSINGITMLQKIKYNFPFIYGFYNFLRYFKEAKIFFKNKKLVYVGIGNKNDFIRELTLLKKINYSKQVNKICKIITKDIKKLYYVEFSKKFYKIFHTNLYQGMPTSFKFRLTQSAIKYLFLSHLVNFKTFYHKNNSRYPLELLNTGIYHKIYHLNFGNSSGNATAEMRQIYLEKFHKNKYLDLRIYKNKDNLNNKKIFNNRFKKFYKKITKFYDFRNYSANLLDIILELKKIKI